MREDVIGRANVEDSPELDRPTPSLAARRATPSGPSPTIEPWEPQPKSTATLWNYEALRPLVLQAADLVTPETPAAAWSGWPTRPQGLGRRRLALLGPADHGPGRVRPGPPPRRRGPALLIEGEGAYTVVDGEKRPSAPETS